MARRSINRVRGQQPANTLQTEERLITDRPINHSKRMPANGYSNLFMREFSS